jgi:uncharacterized protein YodC (DUF2158 family)
MNYVTKAWAIDGIVGHKTLQILKRYTHMRAEDLVGRLWWFVQYRQPRDIHVASAHTQPGDREMAKFKLGETVRLKSGGPDMVVQDYTATFFGEVSTKVICKWFDKQGKAQSEKFEEEGLEPIIPKGGA